jgi:hypothetical protein
MLLCLSIDVTQTSAAAQAPTTTQPASAKSDSSDADDALNVFRAPLLREGSHLDQARATAVRDPGSGEWKLAVESTKSDVPRYELTLLPCARLAEMQRIIESSPQHTVTFQVSGLVLVFRGRNYLLPTYAPVLVEEIMQPSESDGAAQSQPVSATATTKPAERSVPASSQPDATQPSGQSAEDISRELEKAAGPLRRSAGAASTGEASGDQDAKSDGGAGNATRPSRGSERRASHDPSSHPEKLLREGTIMTGRRGKLSRDGSGGWTFVFDADASGLSDPPVRLLPCMLLERVEDYARRVGNNSPALLSGPVYLYNGRNYLLPTVFRIPQDRRNLTP